MEVILNSCAKDEIPQLEKAIDMVLAELANAESTQEASSVPELPS
jgi:hypothetical protein